MPEQLPLDARLLSDAIIELNISRHNVSIYPKDHPLVEKSLNRAFDYLSKLFELRDEITLAIAKDTIIIDEHSLDKKNPVYRDFALHLNKMNIAYVTFIKGLTKEEIYSLHTFLLEDTEGLSTEAIQERLGAYNLTHIRLGLIDYRAFSFKGEGAEKKDSKRKLWEWYVHGLLKGTLLTDHPANEIREIPPDVLAKLVNQSSVEDLKEETYDRVIASYLRGSSERAFTGKDIKKILDFIDELKPELKKQFLASSIREISKQTFSSIEKMLRETPVDRIIELLKRINEQELSIPDDLRRLIHKFSMLAPEKIEMVETGSDVMADDIVLPPDITGLLSNGRFEEHVNEIYEKEIKTLLNMEAPIINREMAQEIRKQWDEEYIDRVFTYVILDLLTIDEAGIMHDEDYDLFNTLLIQQLEGFISTAQYGEVLKVIWIWETRIKAKKPHLELDIFSKEFISLFVDSLRLAGKENREEAMELCRYYGEKVIQPLMHALIEEESQITRRFLLALLIMFGEKVAPEAIRHLHDERWYVKRNMIYILTEIGHRDAANKVKPLCQHENPKVSFQAIRYLLRIGDNDGIEILKEHIRKGSGERLKQALTTAGAFRIKELVPDIIKILQKRAMTGADFEEKVLAVRALGQIADPSAIEVFKHILSSKSLLFKSHLNRLKEEIYTALRYYPREMIRDITRR